MQNDLAVFTSVKMSHTLGRRKKKITRLCDVIQLNVLYLLLYPFRIQNNASKKGRCSGSFATKIFSTTDSKNFEK